jgi:nicotinate-nucleotide adenylyltransferase
MNSAGIFGGNFDPVHNGHLITALKLYETRNLDKIIFIPASISPFKSEVKSSVPIHRVNMLKEAINGVPFFEWSDYEINEGGISYTIDTLKFFKSKYERLELIIGYDNLLDFPKWKDPSEIIKLASLVVLQRKDKRLDLTNRYFDYAVFPETPVIEISSTEIRQRVKNNLSIDFLVPDRVKKYIYKNNLYKE